MGCGVQLLCDRPYSIPFRPGKEDVFYNFSDFFQNRPHHPQRKGQNAQKEGDKVGAQVSQAEEPGAYDPEVERPADQTEHRAVEPDLTAPGPLGPNEQGSRGSQPEQQIQEGPQQDKLYPHPEDAEQVVYHPHAAAQEQGLAQGPGLLGQIDGHPPSRRLKNPPPRCPGSAS